MKKNLKHIDLKDIKKADFDIMSSAEKIDIFTSGYDIPKGKSKSEAFDLLQKKMNKSNQIKLVKKTRLYWSVAASIIFCVLLAGSYFYTLPQQIVALNGQHIESTLPDGSQVELNADSKISYSKSNFTESRILELKGEAFFQVKKGKPFVIETNLGIVKVLGTSLNVYSRDNEFYVSCLTGVVQVTVNNQKVVILPGDKVVLDSGKLVKYSNIDISKMAGWRTFEFNFDNVSLISIFDKIERQFNVEIEAQSVENRFFTGYIVSKDLKEILETICLPMKLKYEIKDKKNIIIKPKLD